MSHLAVALGIVTICATLASAQHPNPKPSGVYRQAGGTVVSPGETGWVVTKANDFETVFQKTSEHEIALVSMKTVEMDTSGEPKALLAKLESAKDAELAGLTAWDRDSLHFNHVRFKSSPCLQYDGIFVATKESSSRHKYLNFRGYICAPSAPGDVVVQLEASSQSSERGMSERLSTVADDLFGTASFISKGK